MNDEIIKLEKDIKTLVATSLEWQAKHEEACAELAEAKEALRVCRVASKLNSEESFHWGSMYATAKAECERFRAALEWQLEAMDTGFFTYPDGRVSCTECSRAGVSKEDIKHTVECASGRIRTALGTACTECGDVTGAFDPSLCQVDPCHCEAAEADFTASGEVDGPDGL